ncbi:MAG: nucleotide disphospho-sugar-binding domain-containing protein, partial [Eubacteriales bacterium]
ATGFSFPVQAGYASNPEFSRGIREYISESGLPQIQSVLEIFDWADLKIVPSSHALEPMDGENILFTGPFIPSANGPQEQKKNIIAYMGTGTISPKLLIKALTHAFCDSPYSVYIATAQAAPFADRNITVGNRFDFSKLMPGAAVYINHGGQNSIMTGLLYGVPQIVCPGRIFERRYNAKSIVNLRAGIQMEAQDFSADALSATLRMFEQNPAYKENALEAGLELLSLGGVKSAVQALERLASVAR